jgi:hypothetical protein
MPRHDIYVYLYLYIAIDLSIYLYYMAVRHTNPVIPQYCQLGQSLENKHFHVSIIDRKFCPYYENKYNRKSRTLKISDLCINAIRERYPP